MRVPAGLKHAPLAQRNATETPLAWLRSHAARSGFAITAPEFDAGERLRVDFDCAQMTQKTGMDWARPVFVDVSGTRGYEDVSAAALDARKRLDAALDYAGPGLSNMLLAVCCELKGLEESEAMFELPRRSGKLMLKLGLSRLSIFYGLQSAQAAAASFRTRAIMA